MTQNEFIQAIAPFVQKYAVNSWLLTADELQRGEGYEMPKMRR